MISHKSISKLIYFPCTLVTYHMHFTYSTFNNCCPIFTLKTVLLITCTIFYQPNYYIAVSNNYATSTPTFCNPTHLPPTTPPTTITTASPRLLNCFLNLILVDSDNLLSTSKKFHSILLYKLLSVINMLKPNFQFVHFQLFN